MEKVEAVETLRSRALEIGQIVTAMHPLVGQVADPAAKGEMLRALFELTKQVEVIKKQALRLQKLDESRDL